MVYTQENYRKLQPNQLNNLRGIVKTSGKYFSLSEVEHMDLVKSTTIYLMIKLEIEVLLSKIKFVVPKSLFMV
jgi:hypothetical protein